MSSRVTRRGLLLGGAVAASVLGTGAPAGEAAALGPQRALYVLGDSWAAGLHADPARALGQVAAQALGWRADVDAVSGTGYLTAVPAGAAYPARAAAITESLLERIAVLQGGSNDDAQDHAAIPAAFAATVAAVRSRLPHASLLALGPGPDPEPVTARQRDVDAVLQREAAALGVPYVSMLQEDWIPAATASRVLDPGNHHPTVAGQRYLGLRLADALRTRYPRLTA